VQRRQRELPQLTESNGDGPSIIYFAGFGPGEPLNQIKRRAVDLDHIAGASVRQPLAPASGISSAPLPKGGSFLNHGPFRSASVQ
jgi:hypothetical protein